MTVGIYWIYQHSRDRAIYVGSSINVERRIRTHLRQLRNDRHENLHLQRTWNKYGADDFFTTLLETATPENLVDREQFWMDAVSPSCNIAPSSKSVLGVKRTDVQKKRLADAISGRVISDETRKRIGEFQRGKKRGPISDSTREKLSQMQLRVWPAKDVETREAILKRGWAKRHADIAKSRDSNNMRIVIPSSNITSWLLRGCLFLMDKHWPGHPPVVVGGYDNPTLPEGVEFINIGEWSDYPVGRWSDGLIKLLESIDDEFIIYTMDDFWLIQDVDNSIVQLCEVALIMNPNISRIDLTDDRLMSGGAIDWGKATVGESTVELITTPPHVAYLFSYQTGMWRRKELLRCLRSGETPAQSEIRGTSRLAEDRRSFVLGTKQAPVKYLIVQQHGTLHFDDPGYQSPGTALLAEDRAELERLGYLRP